MGFYDNKKDIDGYIKIADGYDGRELIEILKQHLPPGSSVLELGMGPGKDLDILAENFSVTGSDYSPIFLDMYRIKHPGADLLRLDAVTLETELKYDCLYSNKVLVHLTKPELEQSFIRQPELLTPGGLLMHSFWYGAKEEDFSGLHFVQYTEDALLKYLPPGLEVIALEQYTEMEENDSLFILLKKSS